MSVMLGCTGASHSKFSALIDAPFLAEAAPPEPATQSFSASAGGSVGVARAAGEVSVEVPRVLVAAFFGVSLQGANDLVFVLDRSGSMEGKKLDQAKAELVKAIDALPDGTRINIVFFGDRVSPLSSQPITLGASSRAQTTKFIRGIHVENSTALVPALWYADHLGAKRVVLLSDGEGNVEGGPPETLAQGRQMIRKGTRFDVVMLYKRQEMAGGGVVTCADGHPSKGVSVSNAGIDYACKAEAASDTVHTLATESGGTFSDPLAPP